MLMQWSQFSDHDLDHRVRALSTSHFSDGSRAAPCVLMTLLFPIAIPHTEPRGTRAPGMFSACSSAVCGSGSTSLVTSSLCSWEQITALGAHIDASNVYGSSGGDPKFSETTQSPGAPEDSLTLGPSGKALTALF